MADLTDKNPNVFYELGIAHTVDKDVIIITQNEKDVSFDVRQLQYFLYKTDHSQNKQRLIEHLESVAKKFQTC